MIDVSVAISVYRGTKYLRRTIASIAEAARYAALFGTSTELIVIEDCPEASLADLYGACDLSDFAKFTVRQVEHDSLGPTRVTAAGIAEGKYIALQDEDDLVSYNIIQDMYCLAESRSDRVVIMPEWLFAFGQQFFLYRMYDFRKIFRLGLIDSHPFISRIFARRQTILDVPFADVHIEGAYAFEDWHHNCELVAQGYEFLSCPHTVFFYRKKLRSMLSIFESHSVRTTPPTTLFEPRSFLARCKAEYDDLLLNGPPTSEGSENLRRSFLDDLICVEMCAAANAIDPAIDLRRLEASPVYSNVIGNYSTGAAYFRMCRAVGAQSFTDVFVMPFIATGGAELVFITLWQTLAKLDPDRRILVITGEPIAQHAWLDRLPPQVTHVDVHRAANGGAPDQIDLLTLRFIEAVAPDARIHLKSCIYSYRFFERYRRVLRGREVFVWRFCDNYWRRETFGFVSGFDFQFISENLEYLTRVITDNRYIVDFDTGRIGVDAEKWTCIYTKCLPLADLQQVQSRARELKHRLLWASRIDHQKRPEILLGVAERLAASGSGIVIEAFGAPLLDSYDLTRFHAARNIVMRGAFDGFESIPHRDFDAFIYTSAFDGIPTVVLKALAAGMPVIAPALGGLPEVVVDGETGILIEDTIDDAALIEAYVAAILGLYQDPDRLARLGAGALAKVREQHGTERYERAVRAIFVDRQGAEAGARPAPVVELTA